MLLPSICHKIRLNQDNIRSQLSVTWFLQLQISTAGIETIWPSVLGFRRFWRFESYVSHLPWIAVEPSSMSRGIQPVLNHYSERIEGRGEGLQLCLSILWTASQHPKLLAHTNMRAKTHFPPPTHTQSSLLAHTCPHPNTLSKHSHMPW